MLSIFVLSLSVMKKNIPQMSDSFTVGLFLACCGGFLDGYTYLLRGEKFATMQTGNLIMFALKIFSGKAVEACYYLIPIGSFFIAVLLTSLIERFYKNKYWLHWRQAVVIAEMLIVLGTGFIPANESYNWLANMLVSMVAGMQLEAFKKIKGLNFATTMCTGNLKNLAESIASISKSNLKEKLLEIFLFISVILFFAGGVFSGYYATGKYSNYGILFVLVFLFLVFVLMFIKPSKKEDDSISKLN